MHFKVRFCLRQRVSPLAKEEPFAPRSLCVLFVAGDSVIRGHDCVARVLGVYIYAACMFAAGGVYHLSFSCEYFPD